MAEGKSVVKETERLSNSPAWITRPSPCRLKSSRKAGGASGRSFNVASFSVLSFSASTIGKTLTAATAVLIGRSLVGAGDGVVKRHGAEIHNPPAPFL